MRPYILSETNWKHLKDDRFDLAILPWGATEAHNWHLPYGTDIIEASEIAAESARKAWESGSKAVVLPTIPYGVNTGQSDIYLDMNLNPSTQLIILRDIITTLNRQGLYKLLIVNSHGGNDFKPMMRELGLEFPTMLLCLTNWFIDKDKSHFFDEPGDHAGEMETSLILHPRPDLVLPREFWGNGSERKHKIQAFQNGLAWTERKWSQISSDTGVGNPVQATADKGHKYFDHITDQISDLIIDLCKSDPRNLYSDR